MKMKEGAEVQINRCGLSVSTPGGVYDDGHLLTLIAPFVLLANLLLLLRSKLVLEMEGDTKFCGG